jgi:Fungal specific transcription factor domain
VANIRQDPRIDDYANLKGPTLLKKTLGLQNHRHSKYLGSTSEFESVLLSLRNFAPKEELPLGSTSVRKVTSTDCFLLLPDSGTTSHVDELGDLDAIESLVAPHGQELIYTYFRIVHPSFPILHKKVFLEKYERTHREFSPPLLAAVYILALNWWSYSAELSLLTKPDTEELEALALHTMSYVVSRPKLSTIQAGLLLLQRPEGDSWALTSKLVALGQDLGLHLDCSKWRIPAWEKGLRKRLGWGLYVQDKWGALVHGRPSHITLDDWMVKPVTEADFPERAADEDDEEGSTEVETGRFLFCEMIKLTEILTTILLEFYTLRAEEDFKQRAQDGGIWVLEKAKPIQLRLKDWFANLPDCLKMDHVKMRKLNSTGMYICRGIFSVLTVSRIFAPCILHYRNHSAPTNHPFSGLRV